MPTYEYKCLKCKKTFDHFQKMTDAPLKRCPKCGGKIERLIGAGAGLIFKGSGFYVTDYRKAAPSDKSKPKDGGSEPKKPAAEAKPKKTGDNGR